MNNSLLTALSLLDRPQLLRDAEVLVQERNEALRDAWNTRLENEQLRTRLRELAAERNALSR